MIDLKRTKAEKDREKKTSGSMSAYVEDYPYGFTLTFDKDTLAKLGIDVGKVDVEQKVSISGVGGVTDVYKSSSKSETRQSVSVQLQKIECSVGEAPKPSKMKGFLAMRDSGPGGKAD